MKFSVLSLTVAALLASPPVYAQALDVSANRTPTLSSVPTISLPNQRNNTIGQAFSSSELASEVAPAEKLDEPERLTPPKIPTTEITRGAEGMTISKPNEVKPVQPQTTPQKKSQYSVGMTLSGTAKVFDGHSFLLDHHPMRLNGVDAPGLKQVCTATGGAAWRCGEAARTFLKRLIDGKRLSCHVDALSGAGAAVSCSGVGIPDVTKLVVEAGLAVVNAHGRQYAEVQAGAQRNKTGLWVGKFTGPLEWRRKNP